MFFSWFFLWATWIPLACPLKMLKYLNCIIVYTDPKVLTLSSNIWRYLPDQNSKKFYPCSSYVMVFFTTFILVNICRPYQQHFCWGVFKIYNNRTISKSGYWTKTTSKYNCQMLNTRLPHCFVRLDCLQLTERSYINYNLCSQEDGSLLQTLLHTSIRHLARNSTNSV